MYTSLAWVPRGVAQAKLNQEPPPNPPGAANDDNAMQEDSDPDTMQDVKDAVAEDPNIAKPMADAPGAEGDDGSGSESGGVDIADVLANDLNSLTFYKSNKDDPLLAGSTNPENGVFDEEEMDELIIRPTDSILVAAKSGEEASTLEFHLFEDNPDDSDNEADEYHPNTYVHHDLVLPAIPLCAAFNTVETDDAKHNLVAVGLFTPGIDIWDVDQVNALMPVQSLGGYDPVFTQKQPRSSSGKKKKSSKKPRLVLKEGSHKDAVLSLSWNKVQTEYLASGSADNTVKIWDVESAHCACTLEHHTDKVQSVAFHPDHADVLLTGSFDKTVHVVDVRQQKSVLTWSVDSDVESCHWLPVPEAEHHVLVATELGCMYLFDRRAAAADNKNMKPLAKWRAHNGPASACSVSPDIPGLFVTGGMDKTIKLWCVSSATAGSNAAKLLLDMPSRVGSVFSASLCPISSSGQPHTKASPFVLAYGGQRSKVALVDLGIESKSLRTHYRSKIHEEAFAVMENRAARGSQAARAPRKGPQLIGATNEQYHSHDSEDDDSSDHDR